ncbi:MAG: hypothetical protein RLY89_642 [Bacteroidota bacterium]|jgi:hypothetical protein
MKTLLSKLFFICATATMFVACTKDEARESFLGGKEPVLTSSATTSIPLAFVDKDKNAVTFNWTNPNYQFGSGVSSQDVTYTLEIDVTGNNFTGAGKQTVSIAKDLSVSFTQTVFNDYLLNQLQLAPGVSKSIDVRVTASLSSVVSKLVSNTMKFNVTPYAIPPKVTPPASGELYITGSAVASSWTNSPPTTQKFTKVNATLYELTVALIGGQSYTFLPTYGSWNDKYSIAIKNNPDAVNGGDFQWQGEDIMAPAVSGTYKISVDFQRGKFTVTKQ